MFFFLNKLAFREKSAVTSILVLTEQSVTFLHSTEGQEFSKDRSVFFYPRKASGNPLQLLLIVFFSSRGSVQERSTRLGISRFAKRMKNV